MDLYVVFYKPASRLHAPQRGDKACWHSVHPNAASPYNQYMKSRSLLPVIFHPIEWNGKSVVNVTTEKNRKTYTLYLTPPNPYLSFYSQLIPAFPLIQTPAAPSRTPAANIQYFVL